MKANLVLMLMIVNSAISSLALDQELNQRRKVQQTSFTNNKQTEFAYKNTRWSNHFDGLNRNSGRDIALNENEIEIDSHKPLVNQHQYVCGRAFANKKYDKNLFDRDQALAASISSTRSKYRPFEIRTPRIIGGDETNPGEFPWTVSVKLNGQPICGGSLINRSWILTAAHCVVGYNPRNLTVRLGAYRIKDSSEQQTIDSPISLFIVHKQYSMPRPFSNDIALLKMANAIEYSDFIVPICLPIEDQLTTSPSSATTSDTYSKVLRHTSSIGLSRPDTSSTSHQEDFDTSEEGIIVSTKMSDKEISRCFKQLEQNYLNSIGLGSSSSNSATSGSSSSKGFDEIDDTNLPNSNTNNDLDKQQKREQRDKLYSMPTMPIDLLPVKITGSFDGSEQLKPISSFANSNPESNPMTDFVGDQAALFEINKLNTENDNKISFPTHTEFNQNSFNHQINQHQLFAITNNQHQSNKNHLDNHQNYIDIQNSISEHQDQHNSNSNGFQTAYHQPMGWNERKDGIGLKIDSDSAMSARNRINLNGNEHQTIKLTSLPISKELLREIQSVGSMQSLSLGLQQADMMAMASDLTSSNSPVGNAGNRERVQITNNNNNVAHGTRQTIRDTELVPNELDTGTESIYSEPTRYSGMTGIVVGWGWVRENDNDNEQQVGSNQRSYQSVTLQKVRLPILRNSDCEAWFRSQEKKITLLPSQFCAGFNMGGKDACRGDSGGPMIIEDNSDTGRYKLIGIVSAGIGCARPSLPGLYTRVASFLPWIHAQMQHH